MKFSNYSLFPGGKSKEFDACRPELFCLCTLRDYCRVKLTSADASPRLTTVHVAVSLQPGSRLDNPPVPTRPALTNAPLPPV